MPIESEPKTEHVDVLIVGAGLSGVGAACHLQRHCPDKSYAILEARESIGGTWDLFRYPGIRSDSDMYTLGYSFKPWRDERSIAGGQTILDYIQETAKENGVEEKIRFGHRVVSASWSSADAHWTVTAERAGSGVGLSDGVPPHGGVGPNGGVGPDGGVGPGGGVGPDREVVQLTCDFLYACTGYYRYDEGYSPTFPGSERFRGEIVHPQHWPEDLDYDGKKIVVIGSGATAMTLVPAMAERAAHVTMVQRSPTYVVSLPARDPIANFLRRWLSEERAYAVARWKNVLLTMASYQLARRAPTLARRLIRRGVERQLSPGYDIDRHFNPSYDPWDQRLCLVPDGDLFQALNDGRTSIVTDKIETFTETGLRLGGGEELEADVIVTATGLNLLVLGGIEIELDGVQADMSKTVVYKGMMFSGIPNLALSAGYTNASWTLKCDLVAEYICRLLKHMEAYGYKVAVPRAPNPSLPTEPFIGLKSGYVLRSIANLPKQGASQPWRLHQNYALDVRLLKRGPLDNEMDFSAGANPRRAQTETQATAQASGAEASLAAVG